MLKKERSTTRVVRSKFIDRIKSTAQFENTHKQNVNLNDIRESSYKLPKSKSNPRYDHSLERKSPIQINKKTQPGLNSFKNIQQLAEQYGSQTITINNTIKLPTDYSQQKQFDQEEAEGGIVRGIKLRKDQLREEEQALDYIKNIWDNSARLKEKQYFKLQMDQIQHILKDIIIAMAKPKFKSIQQNLNFCPQASLKFSPFHDVRSLKQSKDVSNQISVDYLCRGVEGSMGSYESEAQQDIEFKKIMYILEQKSKVSKSHTLSQQNSQPKQNRQLKEIHNILNKKTSCQSSFNCSSRQLSGNTIREFEKGNNSHSNDRVFLKNIVKKSKNSASSFQEMERQTHNKKSRSDFSLYKTKQEQMLEQQAGQYKTITQEIIQQEYQEQLDSSYSQHSQKQNLQPSYSKNKKHIKIEETQETLSDDSDSKRAVLNQIIGMLNKKYHKNIKLQPRQF